MTRYVAEYDGGERVEIPHIGAERGEPEIYRECAWLLRCRPDAHRVEAWRGGIGPVGSGQYVTRATRGVEVAQLEMQHETAEEHNAWKRGPE